MEGWAKDQGIGGSHVTFYADTSSKLTEAMGLVLDAEPVMEKLGNPRCKRFALVVADGVVKAKVVAGANECGDEDTFVEAMLAHC
mmetsp:Transcript_53969/g.96634  ORF Transcript_53969/g.96634 Transcript_53969/m.96634 type:complete len:85 (-) Transcript_53969:145-399(-)